MTSLAQAYITSGKQNAKIITISDLFYKENLGEQKPLPKNYSNFGLWIYFAFFQLNSLLLV